MILRHYEMEGKIRMRKASPVVIFMFVWAFIVTACGGASTAQVSMPETAVPATETPAAEAPTKSAEVQEVAIVMEPGDPERGQDIFVNGGKDEAYDPERVCISCHSLDGSDGNGPTLQGIAERAGNRIPGLSAEEYLHQTIMDQTDYAIEGYKIKMGRIFSVMLSAQEVNDLVAFLLTQTPPESGPMPDLKADFQNDYSAGDPLAGELIAIDYNCCDCHVNHLHPGVRGPSFTATDDLPPVLVRGELRMADPAYAGQATTNQEYVIESILLADAYLVPGDWKIPMQSFHGQLTETELADILAWLERFGDGDDSSAMTPPDDSAAEKKTIDLEMDLPEGDPALGELTALNYRCTGCHDNTSFPNVNGPEFAAVDDLPSILERAELRLTDPAYQGSATTGQEYLVESILYPEAYILPGDWLETMPDTFHEELTAQDLADLIAWMETFSAMEPETAAEQPASTPEPQGALIAGDPQRGQEIFETGGGVINTKCINCHTLDGSEADGDNAGPTMLGIATAAGERVPGLSAEAYLLQSILDPSAYVVEGYEDKMEKSYQWLLNEEDQAALVVFLLTLE
jgi:cytochrome c2